MLIESADRIGHMADNETLKNAAVAAASYLISYYNQYHGQDFIPNEILGFATVCLAGILYICCWAGRDGEWKEATETWVRNHLFVQNRSFLPFIEHKTCDALGEAVKDFGAANNTMTVKNFSAKKSFWNCEAIRCCE